MAFMFSDTNIRSPIFRSKFKSQDDFIMRGFTKQLLSLQFKLSSVGQFLYSESILGSIGNIVIQIVGFHLILS